MARASRPRRTSSQVAPKAIAARDREDEPPRVGKVGIADGAAAEQHDDPGDRREAGEHGHRHGHDAPDARLDRALGLEVEVQRPVHRHHRDRRDADQDGERVEQLEQGLELDVARRAITGTPRAMLPSATPSRTVSPVEARKKTVSHRLRQRDGASLLRNSIATVRRMMHRMTAIIAR